MHTPTTPAGLEVSWAPATPADAAALSELFNSIGDHDETPERLSADSMKHELESYFTPADERTVVARNAAGAVVAYGTVFHRPTEAKEHRVYLNVYVHPESRDQGLDESITDWAVATATDVLRTEEADRRYIAAWFYKKQEDTARRYAVRGFEPVRHWWEMERYLSEEIDSVPEKGFAVVPWEDRHGEQARLVYNSAFADHWGSTPMDSPTWRRLVLDGPAFRSKYSFVAVGEGEVIGYSANEVYPEDWEAAGRSEGWIGGLGVVQDWRKRGVATALLAHSMVAMRNDGIDAAMIGVDAASSTGAQHLYQGVGFRTKITATTWQREVS
ncbi:MAG: GNAT family N-acetyltransferase [bacterium]|nr:GNAT family N-acetyltransferase [bacterium]MCP4964062.1 GNAT family N-acetyltransferase [bacterium]